MTTDDTAAKILKREYYLDDADLPYHDLHDMATLWLMRDSLIEEAHQFWDVEHADPDESQFEAWKARIKALEGE